MSALSVSRYPFITHCSPSTPRPKSRAMAGRATLTTLPSRNTAPEPSTEPATSQRPGAVFSRTGACPRGRAASRALSAGHQWPTTDRLPVVVEAAAGPPSGTWRTRRWYRRLAQLARSRRPAHVAPHPARIDRVTECAPRGLDACLPGIRAALGLDPSHSLHPLRHIGSRRGGGRGTALRSSCRSCGPSPCTTPGPVEGMIPAHRMPLPHSTATIGGFIDPYQHGHALGRRMEVVPLVRSPPGLRKRARERVGRIREQERRRRTPRMAEKVRSQQSVVPAQAGSVSRADVALRRTLRPREYTARRRPAARCRECPPWC